MVALVSTTLRPVADDLLEVEPKYTLNWLLANVFFGIAAR